MKKDHREKGQKKKNRTESEGTAALGDRVFTSFALAKGEKALFHISIGTSQCSLRYSGRNVRTCLEISHLDKKKNQEREREWG